MSAEANGDAMEIALGHVDHWRDCYNYRLNPDDQDEKMCDIDCEFKAMSESLALAIDALVARKVEEERERCAKIADTFAEVAKADARFDAQGDARFIAEQIRGGP